MEELTIKVPGPFAGVEDLGFTARYPLLASGAPAADIPIVIEGPPDPMRRLAGRLRLLTEVSGERYRWSDPIQLSDNVIVMAFKDQSLGGDLLADGARASLDYVANLARPVTFPFLHDCAVMAGLRLAELIEMRVEAASRQVVALSFRLEQVVSPNGTEVLWGF